VLLAHFVRLNTHEHILDLGAGCGVIGLILLYRASNSIASLTAFELQERLAGLARENIVLNQFQNKMEVVEGDLRNIKQFLNPESFSTILCNPPFYTPGSGRQSKNKEAEIARHQVNCSLPEVVSAAAVAVRNRGKVLMVYPANGLATLLLLLEQQRLRVKRMQLVYSYPGSSTGARLVLVEAVKNGGEGVDIMEPFYIYDKKDGAYTKGMQQFYNPN
jgi:tRNA1Val (adenine37-N6)-methyltransferase